MVKMFFLFIYFLFRFGRRLAKFCEKYTKFRRKDEGATGSTLYGKQVVGINVQFFFYFVPLDILTKCYEKYKTFRRENGGVTGSMGVWASVNYTICQPYHLSTIPSVKKKVNGWIYKFVLHLQFHQSILKIQPSKQL